MLNAAIAVAFASNPHLTVNPPAIVAPRDIPPQPAKASPNVYRGTGWEAQDEDEGDKEDEDDP